MIKIGFDVEKWVNKSPESFTDEELLEHYYTMRKAAEVSDDACISVQMVAKGYQDEIIKRMRVK